MSTKNGEFSQSALRSLLGPAHGLLACGTGIAGADSSVRGIIRLATVRWEILRRHFAVRRRQYNFGVPEVFDHLESRAEILWWEWLYQDPSHHAFRQKDPVEHRNKGSAQTLLSEGETRDEQTQPKQPRAEPDKVTHKERPEKSPKTCGHQKNSRWTPPALP